MMRALLLSVCLALTGAATGNPPGFSVERWQKLGAKSPGEALSRFVTFLEVTRGSKRLLFTAFNAWFDISYVDHWFRAEGRSWRELFHYFVLDLTSMAWSLGYRDLAGGALAEKIGIEAETTDPLEHTGITGAAFNAAFYRAILRESVLVPAEN